MKTPPVVYVEWVDSEASGSPWASIEEVKRSGKALVCYTTGYLIHESVEAVTIAHSFHLDERGELAGVCSPMAIPRVAIIKLHKVPKGKR